MSRKGSIMMTKTHASFLFPAFLSPSYIPTVDVFLAQSILCNLGLSISIAQYALQRKGETERAENKRSCVVFTKNGTRKGSSAKEETVQGPEIDDGDKSTG